MTTRRHFLEVAAGAAVRKQPSGSQRCAAQHVTNRAQRRHWPWPGAADPGLGPSVQRQGLIVRAIRAEGGVVALCCRRTGAGFSYLLWGFHSPAVIVAH